MLALSVSEGQCKTCRNRGGVGLLGHRLTVGRSDPRVLDLRDGHLKSTKSPAYEKSPHFPHEDAPRVESWLPSWPSQSRGDPPAGQFWREFAGFPRDGTACLGGRAPGSPEVPDLPARGGRRLSPWSPGGLRVSGSTGRFWGTRVVL